VAPEDPGFVARTHRDRERLALALGAATLLALAAAGTAAGDDCDEPGCAPDSYAAVLALDGDAEAGRALYQTCAVCHLPDAGGRADGTFPRLAGQHRSVIVRQLIDIREGRRANPIMQPHARELLDAQEIADVASYVASLPVPPTAPGRGPGNDLEGGAELYQRDCVGCHGARGEGDAQRAIPALAGQHYAYLLREIRAVAAGRRGNRDAHMEHPIRDYSDAELRAVVDYASRLAGGNGEPPPPTRPHAAPAGP
jgi:cytochrome c553